MTESNSYSIGRNDVKLNLLCSMMKNDIPVIITDSKSEYSSCCEKLFENAIDREERY